MEFSRTPPEPSGAAGAFSNSVWVVCLCVQERERKREKRACRLPSNLGAILQLSVDAGESAGTTQEEGHAQEFGYFLSRCMGWM